MLLFQSTLPRRERQGAATSEYKALQFQSTLPRRERLKSVYNMTHLRYISIHAPAKGATIKHRLLLSWLRRFQSTLPRRERLSLLLTTTNFYYFNPRSREGSDLMYMILIHCRKISIHAPAKGATRYLARSFYVSKFQSTLPRRERRLTN